jgi:RNA polymerase sigma-70 factor (ECF subfamily)
MEQRLPIPVDDRPSGTGGPDEASLIARAQQGDEAAFAGLYRAHYPTVIGCLYRRTGDAHTAEDLAGDTFLAAFKALPKYRITQVPLKMWLLRIATNVANRWAGQRSKLGLVRVVSAEASDRLAPPADAETDRRAAMEEAQAALLALAPEHQAVVSLHYLESMSVDDVAAVLGCRVGTVKSRLSRARDAMRQELERRSNRHG